MSKIKDGNSSSRLDRERSIDLTDAYFHVPIHPQSQKISETELSNQKRGFPILGTLFDVATVPLEFTRIVK